MTMKALSFWRPWPHAVLEGKDFENRTWAPPRSMLGATIAIHAAKKFHQVGSGEILRITGSLPPKGQESVIVGTCRIVGWCFLSYSYKRNYEDEVFVPGYEDIVQRALNSPWAHGSVCWLLDNRRALSETIPCKGHQKLWNVPLEVEQRIIYLRSQE